MSLVKVFETYEVIFILIAVVKIIYWLLLMHKVSDISVSCFNTGKDIELLNEKIEEIRLSTLIQQELLYEQNKLLKRITDVIEKETYIIEKESN